MIPASGHFQLERTRLEQVSTLPHSAEGWWKAQALRASLPVSAQALALLLQEHPGVLCRDKALPAGVLTPIPWDLTPLL